MKKGIVTLTFLCLFAFVTTSCRNKEAEKRIAQLESRVSDLEKQNGRSSSPIVTPASNTSAGETEIPEGPVAAIEFESMNHNFGTIKEGTQAKHTYKFRNTGEVPLVLQNVQGSCGCTTPDWSKDPVAPGEEGFISANFNSTGRTGTQNKTITITANTSPKQTQLKFTANVTPKDGDAE